MRSRSFSFFLKSKYKFLNKIYFFYNIYVKNFKFFKKSSQFKEDIFLQKYFKNHEKGKYLDLGCFHPTRDNNTYQLYRKGWNGINIDLNPLTIQLFNFLRSKDINLNTVLSRKLGKKIHRLLIRNNFRIVYKTGVNYFYKNTKWSSL